MGIARITSLNNKYASYRQTAKAKVAFIKRLSVFALVVAELGAVFRRRAGKLFFKNPVEMGNGRIAELNGYVQNGKVCVSQHIARAFDFCFGEISDKSFARILFKKNRSP